MLGDSVRRRRRTTRGADRAQPTDRSPGSRRLWPWVIAALLLPFAVGYAVAALVLFPPGAEAEGLPGGVAVPELIGSTTGDAERERSRRDVGRDDHVGAARGCEIAHVDDEACRSAADVDEQEGRVERPSDREQLLARLVVGRARRREDGTGIGHERKRDRRRIGADVDALARRDVARRTRPHEM